ncbi:UDP-glucose/GDP-mannose dehydrogenase family, UDP binding domain [compost metagenome]
MEDYGVKVTTFDPWANPLEVKHEYNIDSVIELPAQKFDAIVLGVAHKEFLSVNLDSLKKETSVVYDVKGIISGQADNRL